MNQGGKIGSVVATESVGIDESLYNNSRRWLSSRNDILSWLSAKYQQRLNASFLSGCGRICKNSRCVPFFVQAFLQKACFLGRLSWNSKAENVFFYSRLKGCYQSTLELFRFLHDYGGSAVVVTGRETLSRIRYWEASIQQGIFERYVAYARVNMEQLRIGTQRGGAGRGFWVGGEWARTTTCCLLRRTAYLSYFFLSLESYLWKHYAWVLDCFTCFIFFISTVLVETPIHFVCNPHFNSIHV